MSHTSRISGCLRQKRQRMREVYCTHAATESVTMTPGTMPSTENDLRRRFQRYSRRRRKAKGHTTGRKGWRGIYTQKRAVPQSALPDVSQNSSDLVKPTPNGRRTFCHEHVRYLISFPSSFWICAPTLSRSVLLDKLTPSSVRAGLSFGYAGFVAMVVRRRGMSCRQPENSGRRTACQVLGCFYKTHYR